MEVYDEEELGKSLNSLPAWKRIAFMAQIGERLLPNYERFSAVTGFGDVSPLRKALDAAWTWIELGIVADDLNGMRDACERQAPDTEKFRSPFTSAALDAANVAAAILDALERPDDAQPVEVASLARDTVDLFVQELMDLDPSAPGFEEAILQHYLMQRELRRQREDLEALTKSTGERRTAGRELRARSMRERAGSLAS
jgi:uncharacterized protein YjaG (DUF416 family)